MPAPDTTIRIVARVAIVEDGHLLCAFAKADGFHFLPGGGVEFGESAADAVVRELGEEMGIAPERVRDLRPLGVLEHGWTNAHGRFHEINLVFAATVDRLSPRASVLACEAHIAFDWIALKDLSGADVRPPALRDVLPAWLAGGGVGYDVDMG